MSYFDVIGGVLMLLVKMSVDQLKNALDADTTGGWDLDSEDRELIEEALRKQGYVGRLFVDVIRIDILTHL